MSNADVNGSCGITSYGEPNYCWHRLPCGICDRTNQQCPKAGNQFYYHGIQTNPCGGLSTTATNSSETKAVLTSE